MPGPASAPPDDGAAPAADLSATQVVSAADSTASEGAGATFTLEFAPATPPPTAAPAWDRGSSFVLGVNPELATDVDTLRRARLRAAVLFLILTRCAYMAWRVGTGSYQSLPLQAGLICVLVGALGLLWSRTPLSDLGVRVVEFTVFGLTAVYLAVRQYQLILGWLHTGDEASMMLVEKSTVNRTCLLMFGYCMLMPNTWRTAAKVVLALLLAPAATAVAAAWRHPESYRVAMLTMSSGRISEDLITLALAGGFAVFGTHALNTLRTDVFQARSLNQYRLKRSLGSGGMGDVFLAEHRLLRRPCALKLIRPAAAADPVSLSRFEREVHATARLSHPNIVEVYDYGRDEGGTFFYVMEYLPGLSLDELVKRHGPMPPARVIHLLGQVCSALAEAHSAGMVHRDVKPANVFAAFRGGRHDVVKLLDFGLVMASPRLDPRPESPPPGPAGVALSDAGTVRGTPLYMAPEQITAAPTLDHRCDLYAVGAVAYLLLTGRPPFTGDDRLKVMAAKLRDPSPPPSAIRPGIPDDLERVVLRCLERSPTDRYADARSLGQALDACADAGNWGVTDAVSWWAEKEPAATAPPD